MHLEERTDHVEIQVSEHGHETAGRLRPVTEQQEDRKGESVPAVKVTACTGCLRISPPSRPLAPSIVSLVWQWIVGIWSLSFCSIQFNGDKTRREPSIHSYGVIHLYGLDRAKGSLQQGWVKSCSCMTSSRSLTDSELVYPPSAGISAVPLQQQVGAFCGHLSSGQRYTHGASWGRGCIAGITQWENGTAD